MVKTDVLVYPKNEANPSREFQELNRKRVIHSVRRCPLPSLQWRNGLVQGQHLFCAPKFYTMLPNY